MPTSFLITLRGWSTLTAAWLSGVCAVLLSTVAIADVLVVTDSRHPVRNMAGVRVVELDLHARVEADLTAGLPADAERAAAIVQQRLRDGGTPLERRIAHAYQGVADAWGLGVSKIPAVVVDRRYVIYGEPDVARAVARIRAYRSEQP
ncbi:TIGR03757 family integrating conjugative element protein [Chitinimonas koreensis]|uniref:TIGR03757 family integrating conjugative element protein n=1 Tax=Chitinimonas koreensis TaxID=356302 RepID=UPI0006875D51|nr:TIGR03757 family integrating conjugative element protein [Chitinimonas koreensis]QNM96703.1 TIGR03757 family integrating conjugative element protein [Chitinimonas koreensis]